LYKLDLSHNTSVTDGQTPTDRQTDRQTENNSYQ